MNNYFESIFLIIISLLCFLYAMYFMQHNEKETADVPFAAANFFMGVWNLLRAINQMVPERYHLSISSVTYLVIEFSAYTLFWFSYRYSIPVEKQNKKVVFLPLIFPVATFIGLLYKKTALFAFTGRKALHLWDYLHASYGYILIGIAAVLFVMRCISSFQQNKKALIVLTTALIVFIIQNFVRYLNTIGYLRYLDGNINFFYDICVFLLVNLAFFAMYNDMNGTLISLSKETFFDRTDLPLFVFNTSDDFLIANEAARKLSFNNNNLKLCQYMKYSDIFPADEFRRLGVPQDNQEAQMFYLSNVSTGTMYLCTKFPVNRGCSAKMLGYCCTMFDLNSYNMLLKNMESSAYSDPLTGCLNSSSFFMNIRLEIKRMHNRSLLIVAGLDNLSEINSVLGHHAGDAYIAAAAQILHDMFPSSRVFRMESSTFSVLLSSSQLSAMPELFDSIRAACSKYSKNKSYPLVMSTGYAVIEDRNVDVNTYYETALGNMMLDRRGHALRV
jgi:diguanylate cyclase (GGDEF)-like protein